MNRKTRKKRKQLQDDFKGTRILETERGSPVSDTVENSLWKRLMDLS